MTEKAIMLEVVTPEHLVFSEKTDFVVVPGVEGYLGVLPMHAPIVSGLQIGVMKVITEGKETLIAISNGFMEVSNDRIVVLVDTAETSEEIDVERAKAAKERAEQRLHNKSDDIDFARAELALSRSVARLKATGKIH